jgi:hypothetical protein
MSKVTKLEENRQQITAFVKTEMQKCMWIEISHHLDISYMLKECIWKFKDKLPELTSISCFFSSYNRKKTQNSKILKWISKLLYMAHLPTIRRAIIVAYFNISTVHCPYSIDVGMAKYFAWKQYGKLQKNITHILQITP